MQSGDIFFAVATKCHCFKDGQPIIFDKEVKGFPGLYWFSDTSRKEFQMLTKHEFIKINPLK